MNIRNVETAALEVLEGEVQGMTERERLIELLHDATFGVNKHTLADHLRKETVEAVAEYLLANGVIVPPAVVGQMVYAFCDDFGVVLPYFVENLNIGFMDRNRNYWTYEANCHAEETDELLDEIDFDLDDIGKTVFLTREEAEKALERSRG